MASHPSEPERYSIDEMMERLKQRSSESDPSEGELVTRADGTQAIKVRRRKRRTQQPQKERQAVVRRSRVIQLSAVLVLLFLAFLLAGAAIVFANSSPFRTVLVERLATTSGASVELQQFRMNPANANAGRAILKWPEGNALDTLDLRMVRAQVFPASFLGRSFTGEEITAGTGSLILRPPTAGAEVRATPAAEGELPVRFKRYAVGRLDVAFGQPAMMRVDKVEASLYPQNVNGRPQLLLSRGNVSIPGLPPFRLDRAHIEFRGRQTDVVGMRLSNPDDSRGVFELAGTLLPLSPEVPSTLAVRLESFQISNLAGPEFGSLVSGRIDSLASAASNFLTFQPQADMDAALAVEFRNSPTGTVTLHGLPFLKALRHLLDDPWFETPQFDDDARGTIRRANDSITLGELNLLGKGRLAIRGNISMNANRQLSGELNVGVAEAMVSAAHNARLDSMLGPVSEGFRWITVKPSGSTAAPSDDFRQQYDAQARPPAAAIEAADGDVPSFEDLTRPRD